MKFRDDDISRDTDLASLKKFHEAYKKRNFIHTVSIIARDLWKNREVTHFLETEELLDIQYHGLDHVDYQKLAVENFIQCVRELQDGKEYLEQKLAKPIRVFYPPWNVEGQEIRRACQKVGLKFDNSRVEARDYLRGQKGERVNLHYWQDQEIINKVLDYEPVSNARKEFHLFLRSFTKMIKKMGKVLHVGKTHLWDYPAYFTWQEVLEVDNDPVLKPDICCSIENCEPIKDRTIDGILCFGVYDCVKDTLSANKEIYRILTSGGTVLFGIPMNIKKAEETIKDIKKKFMVLDEVTTQDDLKKFPDNSEYYKLILARKP